MQKNEQTGSNATKIALETVHKRRLQWGGLSAMSSADKGKGTGSSHADVKTFLLQKNLRFFENYVSARSRGFIFLCFVKDVRRPFHGYLDTSPKKWRHFAFPKRFLCLRQRLAEIRFQSNVRSDKCSSSLFVNVPLFKTVCKLAAISILT